MFKKPKKGKYSFVLKANKGEIVIYNSSSSDRAAHKEGYTSPESAHKAGKTMAEKLSLKDVKVEAKRK